MKMWLGAALAGAMFSAMPADAASYYLFDGDSSRAVEIANGAVVRGFDTQSLGYAAAVTDTIWLGNRDNDGAVQYALDGTPTGATSTGPRGITQILDGTTNGTKNFGVTCCGINAVTSANADWSNQSVLFNLGDGGQGIAYDSANDSLYVSFFNGSVERYSMSGQSLGSFQANVAGLAYDQSSDTLWGWDRGQSQLQQYSTGGALLQSQSIDVGAFGISNPFGGEMRMVAAAPEPAAWGMMIVGFGAAGGALRRTRRLRATSVKATFA